MAMTTCDKFVREALNERGCQTSRQLMTYGNRVRNESYTTGAISAALRKLTVAGMAAYSEDGRGQKVYWLTDYGKEHLNERS